MLTLTDREVDWGRVFGNHQQISLSLMHERILEQQRERDLHETARHSAAGHSTLTETAAHLVRQANPGQAAGVLRLWQRYCDRLPAVRKLVASLLESSSPSDREFVRANGLRALKVGSAQAGGKYAIIPRRGERPILVETAPTQRKVKASSLTDDQVATYLRCGRIL